MTKNKNKKKDNSIIGKIDILTNKNLKGADIKALKTILANKNKRLTDLEKKIIHDFSIMAKQENMSNFINDLRKAIAP